MTICFVNGLMSISCNKNLDKKVTVEDTAHGHTFWRGSFGMKKGNVISYDSSISVLLMKNGLARVYAGGFDTAKCDVAVAKFFTREDNGIDIDFVNQKTGLVWKLKGTVNTGRIQGVFLGRPDVSDIVFYMDKQ